MKYLNNSEIAYLIWKDIEDVETDNVVEIETFIKENYKDIIIENYIKLLWKKTNYYIKHNNKTLELCNSNKRLVFVIEKKQVRFILHKDYHYFNDNEELSEISVESKKTIKSLLNLKQTFEDIWLAYKFSFVNKKTIKKLLKKNGKVNVIITEWNNYNILFSENKVVLKARIC